MFLASLIGLFLFILPWSSIAQDEDTRSLYWDALEVTAHLDAEGRLHVSELQRMVFDGPWNGGEREFNVYEGQTLTLKALVRIDEQGREHPLSEGDLNQVDSYTLSNQEALRWRARLPTDPPFQSTRLSYRIDYVLAGILRYTSDGYVLKHDFAFKASPWEIRNYSLRLTLDPLWIADEAIPQKIEGHEIFPSEGYVVRRTLQHTGKNLPNGVAFGAKWEVPVLLLKVMAAISVMLFGMFILHETRVGRFRALLPLGKIDRAWIEQHILIHRPEVVGALWDGSLGAAEVAATLARLTQEGKIASRIESYAGWLFKKHRLHMELKVRRSRFHGYERTLVDALFVDGKETDTDKVRAYYKRVGLDLADKIGNALWREVKRVVAVLPLRPSLASEYFYGLTVVAAMLMAPIQMTLGNEDDRAAVLFMVFATALFFFFGKAAAAAYRSECDFSYSQITILVLVAAVFAFPLMWILYENPTLLSAFSLISLLVFWSMLVAAMLLEARTRKSRNALEKQWMLHSGRAWFINELAKPAPALENTWYPYLLAFGLGRDMDRWFDAFGGTATSPTKSDPIQFTSNTASNSLPWTGGGGSFGGGGASGVWASASDRMAVSIPSSSSSSSSSRGSSSSSGGGRGGGW